MTEIPAEPCAWSLQEIPLTDSTNDLAKTLPPWTAVRADRQQQGRGRRGRQWHSPPGGLWASYTIPDPGHPAPALWTGAAIILSLRSDFGLSQARLRYPNDLMLDDCKLGGLLIEKPSADRLVIGLGLNISNPLPPDAELRTPAARLADHLAGPPAPEQLFRHLAGQLALAYHRPPNPNRVWPETPRACRIRSHEGDFKGTFAGTTANGSPTLLGHSGQITVPAANILSFEELL